MLCENFVFLLLKRRIMYKCFVILAFLLTFVFVFSCSTPKNNNNSLEHENADAGINAPKSGETEKDDTVQEPENKGISFSLPDFDDEAENIIDDEERDDILNRAEQLLKQKN